MNPDLWNPDWEYTFVYATPPEGGKPTEIVGILAMCPYCGYMWTYKGGDKHTATCPGKDTITYEDGYVNEYRCQRKVRLHPYLLKLREREDDPFGRLRHNRGRTPRSELKYPNKNYDHISEVRK